MERQAVQDPSFRKDQRFGFGGIGRAVRFPSKQTCHSDRSDPEAIAEEGTEWRNL